MSARLIFIVAAAFLIGAVGAVFMRGGFEPVTMTSGKALIGGPFTLTSHKGETVSNKDFHGKIMLVSFGYTYCPDICPAELSVISSAMEKLGDKSGSVAPIFITIDPERDTVEQLGKYMSSFHPQIVALTGTEEAIKEAAQSYRVYYAKSQNASGDDYLMDHSTFIYIMGPNGEYVTHVGYGVTAEELADKLREAIDGTTV
jgi:protein SCO1/2